MYVVPPAVAQNIASFACDASPAGHAADRRHLRQRPVVVEVVHRRAGADLQQPHRRVVRRVPFTSRFPYVSSTDSVGFYELSATIPEVTTASQYTSQFASFGANAAQLAAIEHARSSNFAFVPKYFWMFV